MIIAMCATFINHRLFLTSIPLLFSVASTNVNMRDLSKKQVIFPDAFFYKLHIYDLTYRKLDYEEECIIH